MVLLGVLELTKNVVELDLPFSAGSEDELVIWR